MSNLARNDRGGITYASPQVLGQPDQRSEVLAEVRLATDGLTELCTTVRNVWPAHIPMPENLNALLAYQDYVLARLRSGSLQRFAKACAD